jgi:hypothetical protein
MEAAAETEVLRGFLGRAGQTPARRTVMPLKLSWSLLHSEYG